jgi:hypothetical protein
MIVSLINKENIWIPTAKLFFNILDKSNIKLYSENDKKIIESRLDPKNFENRSSWFFNIKFSFNIFIEGEISVCKVRIIKNKIDLGDNNTGFVVLKFKEKYEYLKNNPNFEYEFTKEDL